MRFEGLSAEMADFQTESPAQVALDVVDAVVSDQLTLVYSIEFWLQDIRVISRNNYFINSSPLDKILLYALQQLSSHTIFQFAA